MGKVSAARRRTGRTRPEQETERTNVERVGRKDLRTATTRSRSKKVVLETDRKVCEE